MAVEDRPSAPAVALSRALEREPYRFHFFQALRRLECAYRNKPRIGQSVRASDDPVRLGQEPSLAFAPSTIASFEPGGGSSPPHLRVFFLGLLGPNGPLPLHLTEYARDRLRNFGDPTLARFLDVFHHRMLSLFYRAWAAAQPTVQFDRPESDRFSLYVGALFGMALPGLRSRDSLLDLAKLHYAGHLACQTRHAEGLRALLADYFKSPVRIEEFVGQWMELPEDSRCRLGTSLDTGVLGQTAIAGSRIWDCQHKFRIVFGPLRLADYERLLPGGESLRRLVCLVRQYVGDELAWDVNLILRKEEVPPLKLGGPGQLGRTTWCASRPLERDPDQLLFDPLAAQAS